MGNTIVLYAVKDTSTNKFVLGLTNSPHKFWEKRKFCEQAVERYTKDYAIWGKDMPWKFKHNPDTLKIVKLTLTEEEVI